MKLVAWGETDTGVCRAHNEDSLLVRPEHGLFAVADGMGGHRGGDRASRMAVEVLEREVVRSQGEAIEEASERPDDPDLEHAERLSDAARTASAEIYDAALADPDFEGMGTTLTSVLFRGGRVYLAHVGDSRCYLFRGGRLEQLSTDHSWVEEQLRAGLISASEAEGSTFKHVVTRSVGFEREVEVDLLTISVLSGDCYLLCTDGLSNHLSDSHLRDYLIRGYYSEVPRRLIDTANQLGGEDNMTAVVVYVANDITG